MFSYVDRLKNDSLSKFEVLKNSEICIIKRTFFNHFKLWLAAIFEPVDLEENQIPQRKLWKMVIYKNFETWKISFMRPSKWVLIKVLLFQLNGCGHLKDDSTPIFSPDYKSSRSHLECNFDIFVNIIRLN